MRHHSLRGFTLIEAVVATAVMVTVIASVAHVVLVAASQSSTGRRELQALALSQSKLEELRARPGLPVSGDDSVDGVTRRWLISTVDASEPAVVLMRVCAGEPSVCVATVRVLQP